MTDSKCGDFHRSNMRTSALSKQAKTTLTNTGIITLPKNFKKRIVSTSVMNKLIAAGSAKVRLNQPEIDFKIGLKSIKISRFRILILMPYFYLKVRHFFIRLNHNPQNLILIKNTSLCKITNIERVFYIKKNSNSLKSNKLITKKHPLHV